MDQKNRFAALMHALRDLPSRRDVLRSVAGAGLGLEVARIPGMVEAKKRKHTRKRSTLKRNGFGCVDVGGKCQGKNANCCSGLCTGKKPKKGKRDGSVCVAHDNADICFSDSDTCTVGQNVSCNANNSACSCVRTTGNAGFCGDFTAGTEALCRDCKKDSDCQEELGLGAACVVLGGICTAFCPSTGRTACVPSCAENGA